MVLKACPDEPEVQTEDGGEDRTERNGTLTVELVLRNSGGRTAKPWEILGRSWDCREGLSRSARS